MISVELEEQLQTFLQDKNNVSMSSYKTDQLGRPIHYLNINKEHLWNKFSQQFPNGIKRTAFMTRLADGTFRYREDLGGLCLICN